VPDTPLVPGEAAVLAETVAGLRADDVIWARQATGALLELSQAAGAARAAGHDAIDAEVLDKHGRWFRDAADAGIVLNAARRSKLQRKRCPGNPDARPRR
jgi:hypothetical protein